LGGAQMSTDRDRMLAAINAGTARHKPVAPKPAPLVPARGKVTGQALLDLFKRYVGIASTSLDEVASEADVPAAVARYLSSRNLPAKLRVSPDARVAGLPWSNQPLLEVSTGASDGFDEVSVTPALAGVAETGTLVLHSGAETPSTLHFLPDTHIVVMKASEVVGTYEEALERLKAKTGGRVPRTVNFVTGPSRSADIGKILLMGAHGPKRLHIVLVNG
jgi:L-lactate dehydrogenase complex protein LldG